MTAKPKPKPDNPEQSRRFIEAAQAVGVSEDAKELERAVGKVIKKPAPTSR